MSHLLHLEVVPFDIIIIDLLCALPIIIIMEIFKKLNEEKN